jgi:peptide/nickel transport system permease protein
MAGLVIVVAILLATIFASILAPHDPLEVDVYNRLMSPSWQHWLGTDQLGRDVLSRVLYGGRIALKVSLVAISVSMAAGLLLGMMAGFGPKWLDRALVVCFDTMRSFPTIMFALAVVALTSPFTPGSCAPRHSPCATVISSRPNAPWALRRRAFSAAMCCPISPRRC